MKGVGGKQSEPYETVVTVGADPGTALTAGDTISFVRPFENIPCAVVVCVLGTVALNAQPASVWTATCTITQCVITLESALPSQFWGEKIRIGIIVQEQL